MPVCHTPLDEDTLATVADLRARGNSWDATARQVGWDVSELRRAIRRAPEFTRLYDEAAREVREEVEAEVLLVLRNNLRDPDAALKAAEALAKHLAAGRRDRTRLEVEQMRAGAAVAKANAKALKAARDEDTEEVEWTPEEIERERALEDRWTQEAHAGAATVWLWGGQHKIPDSPPGPGDVPLRIARDKDAVVAGRPVYWAFKPPLPTDIYAGPFPPTAPVRLPEPLPPPVTVRLPEPPDDRTG